MADAETDVSDQQVLVLEEGVEKKDDLEKVIAEEEVDIQKVEEVAPEDSAGLSGDKGDKASTEVVEGESKLEELPPEDAPPVETLVETAVDARPKKLAEEPRDLAVEGDKPEPEKVVEGVMEVKPEAEAVVKTAPEAKQEAEAVVEAVPESTVSEVKHEMELAVETILKEKPETESVFDAAPEVTQEAETAVEPVPEGKAEPEAAAESIPEMKLETEPVVEGVPEAEPPVPEVNQEGEATIETVPEVEALREVEPEVEGAVKPVSEAKPEEESAVETVPEVKQEAEVEVEATMDVGAVVPEVKPEAEAEVEAVPVVKPETEAIVEAVSELNPETEAIVEVVPEVKSEVEATVDAIPEAKLEEESVVETVPAPKLEVEPVEGQAEETAEIRVGEELKSIECEVIPEETIVEDDKNGPAKAVSEETALEESPVEAIKAPEVPSESSQDIEEPNEVVEIDGEKQIEIPDVAGDVSKKVADTKSMKEIVKEEKDVVEETIEDKKEGESLETLTPATVEEPIPGEVIEDNPAIKVAEEEKPEEAEPTDETTASAPIIADHAEIPFLVEVSDVTVTSITVVQPKMEEAEETPPADDEKLSKDLPATEEAVSENQDKKQSGNIISKVKHSFSKVKKVLTGKSPVSKTNNNDAKVKEKATAAAKSTI